MHYPNGYLKGIKALCEKYDILFIADEVMSGFGRTGKWFEFEHNGIVLDKICMANGLTSVSSDRVIDGFRQNCSEI